MKRLRRLLLKAGGTGTMLAFAAAVGVLRPRPARAAAWNRQAFEAKSVAGALEALGAANAEPSADIVITAPDIAENGAVIPVEVTCAIAGAESIALLAENNPFPLVAHASFTALAEPYLSTRIKMGQSSVVRAVVKAGARHYAASREIRVTIGGCGG